MEILKGGVPLVSPFLWTSMLALAYLSIPLENAGHRARGKTEKKRKSEQKSDTDEEEDEGELV